MPIRASSRFFTFATGVALFAGTLHATTDPLILSNRPAVFGTATPTPTPGQDAQPGPYNRAATLEGGASAFTPCGYFPLPVTQSPPDCTPMVMSGVVNAMTLNVAYAAADIALPTAGVPVCIGRTYAANYADGKTPKNAGSFQGDNWFQTAAPEIVVETASGKQTVVRLVVAGSKFYEYEQIGSTAFYRGVNGTPGVMEHAAAVSSVSAETYTLHEANGRKATFLGSAAAGTGQLWKIENPDGRRLYVGHPTDSWAAATSTYYDGSRIKEMIQEQSTSSADDRRYVFGYSGSLIGASIRLLSVEVFLRASGGGWAGTPLTRVDYTYYETKTVNPGDSTDTYGDVGDLMTAKVTLPINTEGANEVRISYYRYYADAWSDEQESSEGYPHALKMVVEPEGSRRGSVTASGSTTATSTLKQYSAAHFRYAKETELSPEIAFAFFNGECGCGSGVNGVYEFRKEFNGSYSDDDKAYDKEWYSRTLVKQPDGTWQTRYFDEAAQPLSSVVTPVEPTGTSVSEFWGTLVERDDDGRISAVFSPAAVSAYNHTTGTLTASTTQGLVTTYTRDSGSASPTKGLVTEVAFKKAGDSPTTLTKFTYVTRGQTLGSTVVDLTRSLVSKVEQAVSSGVWETVDYAYDYWNSSGTVDYYAVKSVKTTYPAVTPGTNGANTAESAYSFLRKDGRVAFTQGLDAVVNAALYNTLGLPSKSIRDVDTASSPGYESIYEPSDFVYTGTGTALASSGTELEYTTEMTYDSVGRSTLTKLPSGRYAGTYYSKLLDERLVAISFPEVIVASGSPTHYMGPASYSVRNLAGRAELSATLGTGTVVLSSTPTSGWVNEGSSDPLDNLSTTLRGSSREKVKGLSTTLYDAAGVKASESRSYFTISTSGTAGAWVGTSSVYDSSTYTYDDMGRASKVVDATATISRTVFDALGRVSSRWIGTSDSSWPPVDSGGGAHASGNMTQVEALEYDANASKGNSLLTKRTAYVAGDSYGFGSSTDKRETSYIYDVRGRAVVTNPLLPPSTVTKYDLRSRVIASAQYSTSSGLSLSTDPAYNGAASTRVAMSETAYDARGQAWSSKRWKITQSNGTNADSLETLYWRDSMGRVIKEGGDRNTKRQYDRFGRVLRQFELARCTDSTYAAAADVANDYVLTESQTLYDDINKTGNVMMTATIARHHAYDSHALTGELDTGYSTPAAYALQAGVSGATVKGRIFITSFWYDSQDRPIGTVPYGTNGNSSYDRAPSGSWASMPSRSSTVLLSETLYDEFGQTSLVKSPRVVSSNPLKTRYLYDAAMRKVAEIRSDTGSDSTRTSLSSPAPDRDTDVYTCYTYEKGLMKTMWVDLNGDNATTGDQVTTYTYGVLNSGTNPSTLASNRLLRSVQYPNGASSTAADNTVTYAYNAQGQRTLKLDQNGTSHAYTYDTAGRMLADAATLASGSTVDNAVLRIATGYNLRGMVETVTQYDAASSGSATDQVAYAYDDWGLLADYQQDNNGLIGASSSVDDYGVRYTFSKVDTASGAGGSATRRSGLRRSTTVLRYGGSTGAASGSAVYGWRYEYLPSSGDTLLDQDSGYLTRIYKTTDDGGSELQLAEYRYGGDGRLLTNYIPVPELTNRHYIVTGGDPYAPFLDRWGRETSSQWLHTGGGIVYQGTPVYDESSNITSVAQYHTPYGAVYESDKLNRLVGAKVGVVSSGAISGTVFAEEDWTAGSGGALSLSQTGNWTKYIRSKDATTDLTAEATFRDNNQYNVRDTDGTGSTALNYEVTYDKNGNLTDDDKPAGGRTETAYGFRNVYDAWNRLRKAYDGNGQSGALVKELRYNGLGHLIAEHADSDGDSDVDSSDLWRNNQYNAGWQLLAVWQNAETLPTEVYTHHNAGRDGRGGSSYIDDLICRERDKDNNSGTLTREERVYYVQNWRHDVVALVRADSSFAAALVERIRYDAYGRPSSFNPADVGRQGGVIGPDGYLGNDDVILATTTLSLQWYTDFGSQGGLGLADGTYDSNDGIAFIDAYYNGGNGYGGGGFGVLSGSEIDNRVGYTGYRWDPTLGRGGASNGKPVYHVRHRVLDSTNGKWFQMDPLGYVDGMNLYEYCESDPVDAIDSAGLCCATGVAVPDGWRAPIQPMPCTPSVPRIPNLMEDTLSEALKSCMKLPPCGRYECIANFVETFAELSGSAKLSEMVRHFRTLQQLWCLRGSVKDVDDVWCAAQYLVIKPMCDNCGGCKGLPTPDNCTVWGRSELCWIACIGLYSHFDVVCAKGPGGKPDPSRHKEKIENMRKAATNCGDKLKTCL